MRALREGVRGQAVHGALLRLGVPGGCGAGSREGCGGGIADDPQAAREGGAGEGGAHESARPGARAGPDEADHWIAEHAGVDDIVVTADIPLAALLAELPREFTARDLGRSPTEASSIIRSLAHRGLIECVARLRQRTVAGVRTSEPAVWRRIEMEDSHAA